MGHLVECAPALCHASGGGSEIINDSIKLLLKRGVLSMSARKSKPIAIFDADRMMMMQVIARGTRGHLSGCRARADDDGVGQIPA